MRRERAGSSTLTGPMLSVSRSPSGHVAVVSQTCDLQAHRTEGGRDLVHVAPVVVLTGPALRDAGNLTKPHYVPIPWFGEGHFVDLDHIAAVDRAALSSMSAVAEPGEKDRRRFAYLLGRYYSRAAFPDDVVESLKTLQGKLATASHASLRRIYDDAITQIRVLPKPPFGSLEKSHLTLYFVLKDYWYPDACPEPLERQLGKGLHDIAIPLVQMVDGREDSDSGKIKQLWRDLLDRMTGELTGRLTSNPNWNISGFTLIPVTSLSVEEYEESDALDLGHLSLPEEVPSGDEKSQV